MATRRSRLQIKPNILSGAKGPGAKPAPKTSSKAANNDGTSTSKSDTSNKVKSPTRLTSPRRNFIADPLKEAGTEKVEKDKNCVENETVSSDKNKNKGSHENDAENSVHEDSKKTSDKINQSELPTRARIRQFGKVNISAARAVKPDSLQPKDDDKKSEHESSSEERKNDSPSVADETKKDDKSVENISLDGGSSQSSAKTVVQRRSRFPKAKPNIVDAGRRKQKESSAKEETASSSAVNESSSKVPEITITGTSINEIVSPSSIMKPETSQAADVPLALTKIQPRLSATPTPVSKLPLKYMVVPTIPVSPEKRARTQSTSEAPVVRRQRKPKVDAPTDKPPDRAKMKMKDLIRWNPTNNPMKPKVKNTDTVVSGVEKENIGRKETAGGVEVVEDSAPEAADTALPVPQVTIGPDGNIVINEKSLIVKGPDLEKSASQDGVIDETDMITTYGSFRKRNMSKRWNKKDTKKFYKSLAMIGIDFFLISQLFPDRTRFEIKKKFKKEEKVNRALVEKVLKERIRFDPAVFDRQEKEEESSDEEEEDEQKGKKGRKKKAGNEPKSQQKPVKKKAVKRRKLPLNYYEDNTTDEDEEQPVQKKSNSLDSVLYCSVDGPWQPPVSQKDGEVVGILMDMSEGRIRGEGQENVMNVMDVGGGDSSEKLVAVPVSKVRKDGGFIPVEPQNATACLKSGSQFSRSSNAPVRTVGSVPAIPGIQSISIMESQQINEEVEEAGPSSMKLPVQTSTIKPNIAIPAGKQTISDRSNRQIILPIFNQTNSVVSDTDTQQAVNLYNPQVQFNHSLIPNSETQVCTESGLSQLQSGTSQDQSLLETYPNQMQSGSSQNQLQQYNQVPVNSNQDVTEDADQYVLVTVMPEGGGETVIHIYRLHGGAQSQNQILYADPYASQQLTLEGTSISNPTIQSQNSADIESVSSNEISANLTSLETPADYTLRDIEQSDVTADENTMQSCTQDVVGDSRLSTVPDCDIQVNISDDRVPELKNVIPVQLTYEPVCNDLTSQSSLPQLIPHESCDDDSKPDVTFTITDTEPEIYTVNQAASDTEEKEEIDVENC